MYTGPKLIQLLEQKYAPTPSSLFKTGTFTLLWRTKVGSFPHPNLETLVSAGEPCGAWKPDNGRPEDDRNVGDNLVLMPELPLNGYIPASSIRGLVRAWAKQRPEILPRMRELLGNQEQNTIRAGKIEFFDAWPIEATKLTLDIVNPQQEFQVYHAGQSTPLSSYTLGDGENTIIVKVAIRGIPGRVTSGEVDEVWGWVQQALSLYGVGSRTASGYGSVRFNNGVKLKSDPDYSIQEFQFTLYSQGCAGPDMKTMELRPSHWRGWLRSWVLRFLLGVMSKENAEKTVGELMGTLDAGDGKSRKGCVRLQMFKGATWGEASDDELTFYVWEGRLVVSAPNEILTKIILLIIRFAVMVGGVGRGWRRPLHIFHNNDRDYSAARGTHLLLNYKVPNKDTKKLETKLYRLPLNSAKWTEVYQEWLKAVKSRWADRVIESNNISAEVFSPTTCAVYAVPGPEVEPLNMNENCWEEYGEATRGDGMYLIYQPGYKRNPDVGGNAAGGNNSHCSWVSIKRVTTKSEGTMEVVCLFMGGETASSNHVRSRFLRDLAGIDGATHLFGVK